MKVEVFYPGYTKKAVTFTIDDGNIAMDEKFLSILAPRGFRGTFNLCSDRITPDKHDFYREFYRGYEISNHVKFHPFVFRDDTEYKPAPEGSVFDPATSDPDYIYPVDGREDFYWKKVSNGWRQFTTVETYIKCTAQGLAELEAVFGKGNIGGFVWPYGRQASERLFEHLKGCGYYGLRATGNMKDSTGFAVPADRMSWSYNATHADLLKVMELFEKYPDDGELKFFSLGVHSVDFQNADKWGDLEKFAELYGNRPADFWYSTVGEIFAYADASSALVITDDTVTNPTDITVYLKLDGKEIALGAGQSYTAK